MRLRNSPGNLANGRPDTYGMAFVSLILIPFLEELPLFWKGSVIRKPNERRDRSDLSAQRIQFNKAMEPTSGTP